MAVTRYKNSEQFINATAGYRKAFKTRYGSQGIRQLPINTLEYPTQDQYDTIDTVSVTWKLGERFYKLSSTYYNNPEYWWVIAWFNQIPLETQLNAGDVIDIPFPLERILRILEV